MDVLMPLAASVVCREGGLSPEDSIAMTAAALLIEGPLALAPAIVAVETQRSSGGVPPTQGDIGPALVRVPKVDDKSEKVATEELAKAKLQWRARYNRATDQSPDGQVLLQSVPAGSLVPEGTVIDLNVAKAQAGTIDDDKQVTEAELEDSLGRVKTEVYTRLDEMEKRLTNAIKAQPKT